jgi:uncharacterized protein DUF7025
MCTPQSHHVPQLRSASVSAPSLVPLVEFLDSVYEVMTERIKKMVADGEISYKSLWYIFQTGEKVWGYEQDCKQGLEIAETNYQTGWFPMFSITGDVVTTNGRKFQRTSHSFYIPEFLGAWKLCRAKVDLITAFSHPLPAMHFQCIPTPGSNHSTPTHQI